MGNSQRDFEVLAARLTPELMRVAYGLTGDPDRARDLVQDTLERIFRRWSTVIAADSLDAYVRRVLVNRFLDWRKHWRWERSVAELPENVSVDPMARIDDRAQCRQMLASLPPSQRAVLVLRYVADMPDSEIAATLSCSEEVVRSRAFRALTRLRVQVANK